MHARFQGLSAFYTAPEAERLFATTGPVKSESDVFADQLESVTTALSEYAAEVRPIEARLKQLREDATAFVSGISGDKHWKDDGDKVEENNDLVKDVNAAVAAFWEAERTCANKITALVCGTHFIADDGTGKSNMYGFSEKDLDGTKELPWGSQVEESRRWWEVHHHVGSFLKGVFVDGLWGTIRGLGTLVGVDGWDAAGQAWTGLAKVVTGLAITITPVLGTVFWALPEEKLPGWFRESRTAVKETGKALVAWDEWGKNPARAAGATTFNVVTTVFTGGAGAAAKTGSVAKVISALGKTGRLLDPVTYIAKGGKVVTVKVGDLLAGLRNVDAGARINIPEPATPAPVAGADDAARAGTGPDPSHTVRLPDDANGSPQYLDTNTGQLLDAAGNPKPDVMPRDVTNPDRSGAEVPPVRSETPVQVGAREPALVGAGPVAGTIDNAAGGGAPGGVTPGAGTPGGTPGGVTPGGGAVPGAVTPGGGAVPGGGGLDGLPGGGANNLPGGGAGQLPGGAVDNLPGGGASNLPGGGANHVPGGTADNLPSNSLGDDATPGGGAATTPDTTPGGGTGQGDGVPGGGITDDGPGVGRGEVDADHGPIKIGPEGGWTGAGWIERPDHPLAGQMYETIRATNNRVDLPAISRSTGVTEGVLREVKSHMFRSQHELAVGPGQFNRGLFTPRLDVAQLWMDAQRGLLDESRLAQFKYLMAHEFIESRLMKAGLPYVSDSPAVWQLDEVDGGYYRDFPDRPENAGAHDLASNDKKGGFAHWAKLGLKEPDVALKPDLSNLGDIVKEIGKVLRAKGIELR
ncbi:hypothetical protein OG711_20100 [Streptomyces uncialis]|uniref:hypothetical protein n=1 Tax=Streptomyces uncialis TaxID=1048205 RepID=UPI002E2F80D7|nr:hypothetical protein [Streptomyces uncialis]